jgi:hypothetical protein
MGRPSKYTDALLKQICDRLSEGEPLAAICRDDGMPCVTTVWQWEQDRAGVSESIARARKIGFDKIASDCLEIADDATNDYVERKRADGSTGEAFDAEHVQRSKLRIWTRLELLKKWDPKRYGDKQLLGSDPENPLPPSFQVTLVKPSDDAPGA